MFNQTRMFTFKWRIWYAFLINIQMDSIAFDLYSGAYGGFTFNSSLNFTSFDFSSRLFTYLQYFSLNVFLFLTKPGCLQWNKKVRQAFLSGNGTNHTVGLFMNRTFKKHIFKTIQKRWVCPKLISTKMRGTVG